MNYPIIHPIDVDAAKQAQARQDNLTKPAKNLDRLEEISIQLAGMKADPLPDVSRKAVIVRAADHGVALEGVSAFPAEVTPQNVDPCGENGEFHTFVFDGPIFKQKIDYKLGDIVHREYKTENGNINNHDTKFWYRDILVKS